MVTRDYIEKALIFGMVKIKDWTIIIKHNIEMKHFLPANRPIFKFVKEYADKNDYPDIRIVCAQFGIDEITLQELLDFDDYDKACDSLKIAYIKEYLDSAIDELNEHMIEVQDDPDKYIERLGNIYSTARVINSKVQAVDLFDNIEDKLGNIKETISTGFKELDDKLVGWQRGEELVVFMGRTGQGKSWLGLKFAMSAAEHGEKVGIYSGEMSQDQLQERIICCAKQYYTTTKEEAIQYIRQKKLSIKVITQRELRHRANIADIEKFIVDNNLTMLVIDQLSLMEDSTSKPGTPIRQQYGNISMDLFTLSSKYNLPVILLVQSNRQGSDNKNGPALENIAESDAVAQNATRVISMKNENKVLTMNILKNRYGDNSLTQRYEVDFGLNKYKPIQDSDQQTLNNKNSFRNKSSVFSTNRIF